MTTITVSIVLHDSGPDIEACLTSLRSQTRSPDEVVVLDNASSDGGLAIASRLLPQARLIRSQVNLGFAGGQNRAMAAAPADAHLVLNPDCRLAPDYIEVALGALEGDPTVGSVTGRLLRFRPDDPVSGGPSIELPDDRLDSTGMVALRNRRVLDRGTDEIAQGRYCEPAYVFGVTGAAALFRRAMLEDVAFEGEVFDERFFAYREDVDLAWRAQLLGWRCRYEPTARARHRRRVAPGRRRRLPSSINRMSIANRWRMIAKNELWEGWRRDWPWILSRDIAILGYCALGEQRSLLALGDVFQDRLRLRQWRRELMRRRRANDESLIAWFGRQEQYPLPSGAEDRAGAGVG